MHSAYCNNGYTVRRTGSSSRCCEKTQPDRYTIPESIRQKKEVCSVAIVTVPTFVDCSNTVSTIQTTSNLPPTKIEVPVVPGTPIPIVEIGTISASVTVSKNARTVLSAEYNQYNPGTRFRQYFPTPPVPYVCPVRIPTNEPKPSLAPCASIQRFKGSEKK